MQMSTPNPSISVRGYGSFSRKAGVSRRLLAVLTDLPVYLLGPAVSVLALGVSPLPDLKTSLAWAGWVALVFLGSRLLFKRTLGEWAWGLKKISVLMESGSLRSSTQVTAIVSLAVSLLLSQQLVSRMMLFHPLFRAALPAQIPAFNPQPGNTDWSVLPFYLGLGAFPKTWNQKPVWYQLPYLKGPPERYPARVVVRLPDTEARITLEGPRTPESLRGKRDWVRACMVHEELRVRVSADCLALRKDLLLRHTAEMRPGGRVAQGWGLHWFETENPALGPDNRPMGVYLKAYTREDEIHRFILLTSDGQAQALSLEYHKAQSPVSTPVLEPELEAVFKILGSMSLHPNLAATRSWADRRLSEVRLQEVMRKSELGPLSELSALLIAKTTVNPRSPEAFFHLTGVSLLLLKKSAKTAAAELVSAVARPQVLAASRYFKDVAPEDPRNGALEQMVLEMKQFK